MRVLLTLLSVILFGTSLFSQKIGDQILVSQECSMYDTTSIMGKETVIPVNDTITLLKLENKSGYCFIKYHNLTGYMNSARIAMLIKNLNPTYRAYIEKERIRAKSLINEIEYYTNLYGKPDDTSEYQSDDYISRTLVWHCAKGNYRSIDFRYMNGSWIKTSVYTSSCI